MREEGHYWIKIRRYEEDEPEWIVAFWHDHAFYYWCGSHNEERFYEPAGYYNLLEVDERRITRDMIVSVTDIEKSINIHKRSTEI